MAHAAALACQECDCVRCPALQLCKANLLITLHLYISENRLLSILNFELAGISVGQIPGALNHTIICNAPVAHCAGKVSG